MRGLPACGVEAASSRLTQPLPFCDKYLTCAIRASSLATSQQHIRKTPNWSHFFSTISSTKVGHLPWVDMYSQFCLYIYSCPQGSARLETCHCPGCPLGHPYTGLQYGFGLL